MSRRAFVINNKKCISCNASVVKKKCDSFDIKKIIKIGFQSYTFFLNSNSKKEFRHKKPIFLTIGACYGIFYT